MSRDWDATEATVVTLRLDPGTETISGTLANRQGDERPFWGWLELSGALDDLRGARARAGGLRFTKPRPSTTNESQEGQ